MTRILYLFLVLSIGFIACSDDDDSSDDIKNEWSFSLDGESFNFSDFVIDTTWLSSQNRLFLKKEDGNNVFTLNFPLDINEGPNGMDWNGGGVWFFMETDKGSFYTLDEPESTMNVIKIDTDARTISATYEGVGSQVINPETTVITNGVLKLSY